MNINDWLNKFKYSWENKNIDDVLLLFSANVIYYETPFHKLNGLDEIKKEWLAILDQNEIDLRYSVFSIDDNKYTIQWDLKYFSKDGNQFHFSGVYLIKLNEMGLCDEFRHYCEKDTF
ncbi:nuclear transport factor 2 family protein [Candidatus Gracilibacteria bacterium]|nr:nuclear transport factor 2 family protein [Candidatus Gracilibacteria bacterium]